MCARPTVVNYVRRHSSATNIVERCGSWQERMSRLTFRVAFVVIAVQILGLLSSMPAMAAPPLTSHLNPIPFYSQGSRPWCGVATARMTLAYVLFPQEPPSLESIAVEVKATGSGVRGTDWQEAMEKRKIPIEFYTGVENRYAPYGHSPDLKYLRDVINRGFAVEASIVLGKEVNWFYYIVYNRIVYDYILHSVMLVGYDSTGFIYHDPDVPHGGGPAILISDMDFLAKWYYVLIVGQVPRIRPCYSLKLSVEGPNELPIKIDGSSTTSVNFTYEIGRRIIFEFTKETVVSQNRTTKVMWKIDQVIFGDNSRLDVSETSPINVQFDSSGFHWYLGSHVLRIQFRQEFWYWVKINNPKQPSENWIVRSALVATHIDKTDRVLPAEGILGVLGFKRGFVGWRVNDSFMNSTYSNGVLGLTIRVDGPMEISPVWQVDLREGNGYDLLMCYLAAAAFLSFLSVFLVKRFRRCRSA